MNNTLDIFRNKNTFNIFEPKIDSIVESENIEVSSLSLFENTHSLIEQETIIEDNIQQLVEPIAYLVENISIDYKINLDCFLYVLSFTTGIYVEEQTGT